MKNLWIVLGAALVLAETLACQGKAAWEGSIETQDGVRIVRNPKTPIYPQGALGLQEELTIGTAEGAEEYMFDRLRWLAVDNQGTIFALDQRKPCLAVFSDTGQHLRSIGRRGQGPGEFQTPFFVALAPSGEILVGQMGHLSFFDHAGDFLRSQNNTIEPLAFIQYLKNGDAVGTRMVMEEENPRYEVVLCGPDLKAKETLDSSQMPSTSGKYSLFASVIRWDIRNGNEIVCGSGEDGYHLRIFDAGGHLIRTIQKEYDPVPVTDWDIDRQMKQHGFQSREEVTYSRFLPPIWWIHADDEGRIYVSTWQRDHETEVSLFNIFDSGGRYLCDCYIPGEPIVIKNRRLYAIVQDNEGIQYIKRYRMIWKH